MKTVKNYRIDYESDDEQRAAGRYNPAMTITYRVNRKPVTATLGAGTDDCLSVFSESGARFYVLNVNRRLGYCGIEVFNANGERVGKVFCQNPEEDLETSQWRPAQWEDWSDIHLCKVLANYAECSA